MIPDAAITHWSVGAPWPTRTQVEQDLLLSRLICEIAADPYLGEELIFRGGTCFHKLHIHPARRYSEDLDYVRSTAGGIKEFTTAMSAIGAACGFTVKTPAQFRYSPHTAILWSPILPGIRLYSPRSRSSDPGWRSTARPVATAIRTKPTTNKASDSSCPAAAPATDRHERRRRNCPTEA